MNLVSASSSTSTRKPRASVEATASNLATLLACVSIYELHLRPHAFVESAGAVGSAGILRYLRVCATNLPRPAHPTSLHAGDHLAVSTAASLPSDDDPPASGIAAGGDSTTSPVLGDVLESVLKATAALPEGTGSGAVWEAVSAVVLDGYERRPLSALAAFAINGVSESDRRSGRQQRRGGGGVDGKIVAAARALCVAATFIRAAAEAAVAGDTVKDEESMTAAEKDLVAVFPAAVCAVASADKVRSLNLNEIHH